MRDGSPWACSGAMDNRTYFPTAFRNLPARRPHLAPLGGWRVHERVIFQAAIAACLILSSRARSSARHEVASGNRVAISAGSCGSSSARAGLTIRV
jgi:hypothetical protein